MRLIVVSQKRLEQLIEAGCTALKQQAAEFQDGHLRSSPAGAMYGNAEHVLHDLRRTLAENTVQIE